MEATEVISNGKSSKNKSISDASAKVKQPRKVRPAPVAYAASDLKEPNFPLPKVAQKGVGFNTLPIYASFSLTPDGEALCIKKTKSEGVRLSDGRLFDGANLTVHQLVW